jgi:hypothetical protein
LQLEVPRELSLSVRPWRRDLYLALAGADVTYAQVDLNLGFWRSLLAEPGADWVGHLIDLPYQTPGFNRTAVEACERLCRRYELPGMSIAVSGVRLDEQLGNRSSALLGWVRDDFTRMFWEGWLQTLKELQGDVDVVSFAVGSVDDLAMAGVVADWLRRERPQVHTCLAFHRWENFSLLTRLKRLVEQGALLDLFDSVLLREDRVGQAAVGLCRTLTLGDLSALQSVAVRVDGQARLFDSVATKRLDYPALDGTVEELALANYLESTGLPRHRMLMLEALVRNDCHYGRCTFCVQNIGYPEHQGYKHAEELARSRVLIEHLLRRHGVRFFSFADQAVHPTLLEKMCETFSPFGDSLQWAIRMLPADALAALPLLEKARSAGCREILLGLESTHADTLQRMDKAQHFGDEAGLAWLTHCQRQGINVTLSAIRGYPSESDADFERTTGAFLALCESQHTHVTVIVNDFVVFDGSAVASNPSAHGITLLLQDGGDLEMVLGYVDEHDRNSLDRPEVSNGETSTLVYLGYSSFGLLHKWTTGRWLSSDVSQTAGGDWLLPGRDVLVLGASGYLGRHAARALDPSRMVLASRRGGRPEGVEAPGWCGDLTRGPGLLRALRPREVWVCARPISDSFEEHAAFQLQLQSLLDDWAREGTLRRVVVFSTQLVAQTPKPGELVCGESPLSPEAAYDCAMAQLEVFSGYLSRLYGVDVDIVRLPLLWGGRPTPADRSGQFLHRWQHALSTGSRWHFSPGDEVFGNSWVDIDELLQALLQTPGSGLRVRTAKSGDFTYSALQASWASGEASGDIIPLPRSTFYVADEFCLPQRGCPA